MKINKLWILIFLIFSAQINATSLVYNLKIRRQFNLGAAAGQQDKSKFISTAVPIIYQRNRNIIDPDLQVNVFEKTLNSGVIFNFRYVSKKAWWLEGSTAIENEKVKLCGISNFQNSRTGIDDIVLSGGYNFHLNEKSQFVLYGLTGFPTKTKVTAQEKFDTLVGTRFYALGGGAEFSYAFINSLKKSLVGIIQTRFIHFFARKWFPILPRDAKIEPGNVTDILLTLQFRQKKNIFEFGYNPTFFTNQAVVLKTQTIDANNFIRQSGYVTYTRLFKKLPVVSLPGVIGCGLSLSESKRFDTKIAAVFLNFSAAF